MCGRFALYTEPVKIARYLQATNQAVGDAWQPSWNIPPTMGILGARERVDDNGEVTRSIETYRWGLVPFFAKDPSVGNRAFNARAETVATKPMFRRAFQKRRILVPADAFYEWKKTGGPKDPYAFRRTDGDPLVFAGLCEYWKAPDDQWLASATIITTGDGPDMHDIHNRMPVILEKDSWDEWLNPGLDDPDELLGLLRPSPAGTLQHYPVSKDVGKVDNDQAYLLEVKRQ
ncbi:MAG: SOS response-associated peptidase [Acidimicrobiales bacterium]